MSAVLLGIGAIVIIADVVILFACSGKYGVGECGGFSWCDPDDGVTRVIELARLFL